MSRENVEIVEAVVAAFNEGGLGSEATLSFFDAAAVFEEPPEQPSSSVGHGRDELQRLFTEFDQAWEEHRSEIEEIRAIDDERVLLLSVEHFEVATRSRSPSHPPRSSRFKARRSFGCRRSGNALMPSPPPGSRGSRRS